VDAREQADSSPGGYPSSIQGCKSRRDKMVCSVMSEVRAWKEADVQFGHVAINAGAVELRKGNFADVLLERLRCAQVPASVIQVEVTETVFLGRGAESVQRTLRTLASEGIRIALDDFGTGFASLSHLARFPVHALKIDRSFVSKLEHSTHDAAIIRAIIKLGRSLGVEIVAEGVESEVQLNFLKKHRCHHGQGYFFARAQPASEVPHLIAVWAQGGPAAFRNLSERRSTRLAA
jgi:EAL domain-containing protein (putative c-di-GMP-specific phosphodiesterase class I)